MRKKTAWLLAGLTAPLVMAGAVALANEPPPVAPPVSPPIAPASVEDVPDMKPGYYEESFKIISMRNVPARVEEDAKDPSNLSRHFCYDPDAKAQKSPRSKPSVFDMYEESCKLISARKTGPTHRISLQCRNPEGGINMDGRFERQSANFNMEMWLAPEPGKERGEVKIEATWKRTGSCPAGSGA